MTSTKEETKNRNPQDRKSEPVQQVPQQASTQQNVQRRAELPPIKAPVGHARMLEIVFPQDTNHQGTAFGGWVISLMDKAACVAAVRYAAGNVVTVRMDAIDFHIPIRVGDAAVLDARVISVGRSSMKIRVDVYREKMSSGEQRLATNGIFTFVALDEDGKPRRIPPLETVESVKE